MFTFDVVSESVRNPHLLAAELTKRSSEGWEVVEIVYDGNTWLHAFIRHAGRVAVAPYPGMSPEEAAAPAATSTPSTTTPSQPFGTGNVAAPAQSAPTSGGASVPNPPANWYKDPSGRHELRYWNGSAWTEHVADGGRQSIDPPRA
jgi:hypothetical protein